ncbi:MAG: lipoprotein-releasing system ATP-binding protein, partial [Pseudomonadota bacterium]
VAVARALLKQPKILLVDEPTGNLDYENSQIVLSEILQYSTQQNSTLIMVTHDMNIVKHFDSHYTIENGNLSKLN